MSGPTPMTLGPYAFEGLGFGFSELDEKLHTPWADIAVTGRLHAAHWVGPKEDVITIKGVLFPQEFGGLGSLNGIRDAALNGTPLALITMDGAIRGLFRIEGVDKENAHLNKVGTPGKTKYEIHLKRLDDSGSGGQFAAIAGALAGLF